MVSEVQLIQLLDKIGTIGLAFIVWALMTRRLVTRGELDREVARGDAWEQRFDRSITVADRALDAGQTLAGRNPAKR